MSDKNNRLRSRRMLAASGSLAFLFAAGAIAAQETNAGETLPREPAVNDDQPAALLDPFVYHAKGEGNSSFVPAPDADMPRDIAILATMEVKDGKSWAVLRIGKEDAPVYVTEKSVIYVAPNVARQSLASTVKSSDPVYLMIHSIKGDTVEISPHKRPQDIHVFQ